MGSKSPAELLREKREAKQAVHKPAAVPHAPQHKEQHRPEPAAKHPHIEKEYHGEVLAHILQDVLNGHARDTDDL